MKALLVVVGGLAVIAFLFFTVVRVPGDRRVQSPGSKPSASAPAQRATPTPAPSTDAVTVAERYVQLYEAYDWQHPDSPLAQLQPLSTARLYGSLQGGMDPTGAPVPWQDVRPDLHEQDAVQVASSESQWPSPGQQSVQLQVSENLATDVGHSQVQKEFDLSMVQQQGAWKADYISERERQ